MSLRLLGAAPRLGLGLVLVGVLVATLFLLPRRDEPAATGPPPPSGPAGVVPTATGAAPSEEAFCAGFRTVAAVQGQYLAQPDETGAALLRDALDDLLATGVPDSMDTLARTGYLIEMTGLYGTLGEELDPSAVPGAATADGSGAADSSLAGAPGAFGQWLTELCPGR